MASCSRRTADTSDADLLFTPENGGSLETDCDPSTGCDVDDAGDEAGASLVLLPDRSGDGYNELLIGAPAASPGITVGGGTLYLIDLSQ